MKPAFLRLAIVTLALLLAPQGLAGAVEIWVSPQGDDTGAGTRAQPLATVDAGLRRARELRRLGDPAAADGVSIRVHGGVYRLHAPLFIRPEDSGTATSPTIIEAVPGEQPVLSGGVPLSGWQRVAQRPAAFPVPARGELWVAEAPRAGGRRITARQLWIGDRKALRARSTTPDRMERLLGWDRVRREAVIPADLVRGLGRLAGLEMVVQQQWAIAILRVKNVRTEGDRAHVSFEEPESKLEFEHPWPQPILPPEGGGGFFLRGCAEFVDQPGEWWQDPGDGRIYYWPRGDESLERLPAVVPGLPTLLQISGSLDRPVAHVSLRGLHFSHTAWLRPAEAGHVPLQAGMHLLDAYKLQIPGTPEKPSLENQAWIGRMAAAASVTGARHVELAHCTFAHLGAAGLDLGTGVVDSVVHGCMFRDIGGNAIQAGAFQTDGVETHVPYNPSDEREIVARIRISNNLIVDCGNEDWGCVGLAIGYARAVSIEHNELSDLPYTGISVGWGWTKAANVARDHRVHANRLRRIATRMCDTAGIYTLSPQPGTVISENVIESIVMAPHVDRPEHWFYLYTDEGSSFITVRDNWCPEERFLQNANGPGNVWARNGPMVSAAIRAAAGLEPAYQDLRRNASP